MAADVARSPDENDLCHLVSVFSTSTRQRIIRLLASERSYTFTEILNHLRSFDENIRSNNLSYHLKELGDLIDQNERAEYRITAKGQYVKEILDDLEATTAMPSKEPAEGEMFGYEGMGIEKVVIGGMLMRVSPTNFAKFAQQREAVVIHSKIGTFRPKDLYITCIDGVNYYCKSKRPLEGLERITEAGRIEIPKNMIMDI